MPLNRDWESPVGDTILDILEDYGWSEFQLADKAGLTIKQMLGVIDGSIKINEDIASKLSKTLGGSTDFWLWR
jgi:HTH-type transcriptional regulator/antitoxin HigA